MGHSGSVQRPRGRQSGVLYGEPVANGSSANGTQRQYTPAQLQALYLSRGRPDMAFMANQSMMPKEVPEMQQTYTVKNHVNLKKGSLKLVPLAESSTRFDLIFTFDATKPCRVSVYTVALETIDDDTGCSTYSLVHSEEQRVLSMDFSDGLGQEFRLSHIASTQSYIDTSAFSDAELTYTSGSLNFPLIIVLEVRDDDGSPQSQTTFATFVPKADGSKDLKMLKQKIQVDGLTYELQEIYGIDGSIAAAQPKTDASDTEHAGEATAKGSVDEIEIPEGAECIICLSEPRNTTVLPCRHMCLCSECAEHLRKNASTCPICRTRVEALLQIRVDAKDEKGGKE